MSSLVNLVDPTLNWGASFRFNPLFLPFAENVTSVELLSLPQNYLLFCKFFFLAPIFYALFQKFKITLPFVVGALICSIFTASCNDSYFWASLHSLPLCCLLVSNSALDGNNDKKRKRSGLIFNIVAGLLWGWAGGPQAFLITFFIFWLGKGRDPKHQFIFLFTALFSAILFLSPFPIPVYPFGARISEISSATFWAEPLLGPSRLNPTPLNYSEFIKRISNIGVPAFTNLLLVLVLLLQMNGQKNRKNYGSVSPELKVILVLSLFLIIEWQSQAFLTLSLSSLMFGLILLPSPLLLASAGLVIALTKFLTSKERAPLPFNIGFIILVFFYLTNLVSDNEVSAEPPLPVGTQFSNSISSERTNVVPAGLQYSKQVIKQVSTNVEPNYASFLVDGDFGTHWSSNRPLHGDEKIELEFSEPIDCQFLSLLTEKNQTDFPRGIKIEATEDGIQYNEVANLPSWKGPIKETPEGLIYFGSQSEVNLKLKTSRKIMGLRIYQTGKDDFFYWTISEIRCGTSKIKEASQ